MYVTYIERILTKKYQTHNHRHHCENAIFGNNFISNVSLMITVTLDALYLRRVPPNPEAVLVPLDPPPPPPPENPPKPDVLRAYPVLPPQPQPVLGL